MCPRHLRNIILMDSTAIVSLASNLGCFGLWRLTRLIEVHPWSIFSET